MSETYIGTTERAAIIRKALKETHKWSSKDVSVRANHYSMGSSIEISIKNPDVKIDAVKAIASEHERIDRDEMTGEILSGGNRFVNVGYSQEARQALTARMLPAVEAAAVKLTNEPKYLIPIDGTTLLLGAGRHGFAYGFSVWQGGETGSHLAEVCSREEAAFIAATGGRR